MVNPESVLKSYLETLVHHLIYLNSILDQVNEFNDWFATDGDKAIHIGGWFYKVSLYSFKRILTIEACKLLLKREQRSLIDWLNRASEHANSLNPSYYVSRIGYTAMDITEYRNLIEEQKNSISNFEELIQNMKSLRDKGFTHSDKEYFDNPAKLETDFQISWNEFNDIYSLMSSIVKKQYSLLFNSDMNMHLSAHGTIKTVLNHTRAFQRVLENRELHNLGLRLYTFKSDDYDPVNIYLPGSRPD